jgi:predicted transposase/invertase (TIGR01784 family)
MKEVVPLRYGVAFKKAFGKLDVFNQFVRDVTGVPIEVTEVFQEYEYKKTVGNVKIKYDLFAEDPKQRAIVEIQHIKEWDFWARFWYYHIIAMVEQVKGCEEYKISKDVYTIVVLTTLPRDKSIEFSVAASEADPVILDADKKGVKVGVYRHKILYLNPRLVSENTPEPIRAWLELIKDTLDSQVEETLYPNPLFQKIIHEIESINMSPEEAARLKEDADWERVKEDARREGKQEGIEIGEKRGIEVGKQEMVKMMLAYGKLTVSEIAKITGISKEEIEKF